MFLFLKKKNFPINYCKHFYHASLSFYTPYAHWSEFCVYKPLKYVTAGEFCIVLKKNKKK